MKNFYSDFPVLPYQKTSVAMPQVVAYIKSLEIPLALKIAVYILFRNESANGTKGVCNNYIGMQSDNGKWDAYIDKYIAGTCIKAENMTGKTRGFLCFGKWQDSVDILAAKLQSRGLYVGGTTHLVTKMYLANATDWANAYVKEWVQGSAKAKPSKEELKGLLSMYQQGQVLFS
jgi:hypothetical protein